MGESSLTTVILTDDRIQTIRPTDEYGIAHDGEVSYRLNGEPIATETAEQLLDLHDRALRLLDGDNPHLQHADLFMAAYRRRPESPNPLFAMRRYVEILAEGPAAPHKG